MQKPSTAVALALGASLSAQAPIYCTAPPGYLTKCEGAPARRAVPQLGGLSVDREVRGHGA